MTFEVATGGGAPGWCALLSSATSDVVAGPRPCAPPRWRRGDGTMGDPRRFEVFARFLRTTFPAATTVADVAGGHGELAFWLAELGLRPTIIDPRPATFPRWVHRTLRKRAVRGGPGGRPVSIERLLAPVEDVDLRPFDLVAALHPDAATELAVRAAVAQGVDFAVVPCCVFPLDGIRRSRAAWLAHLAFLAPGVRVSALPIGGANAVLWWRGRTQGTEGEETAGAEATEADPLRDVGDAPAWAPRTAGAPVHPGAHRPTARPGRRPPLVLPRQLGAVPGD